MAESEAQKPGVGTQDEGDDAASGMTRRERLAAAAERRRNERAKERAQAAAIGLDASERVDDALSRVTDKSVRFVRRHFNVMQWVFVSAIAIWVGLQVYHYRRDKNEAKVGDALMKAANAAQLPLLPELPEGAQVDDRRPSFPGDQERLEAARGAYVTAASLHKNDGAVALAELGLAAVQLDQGKAAEARATYEKVKAMPVAAQLLEVRGRALEGIALSHEIEGKNDAALKAYRELENSGIEGFVETALLAQARVLLADGKTDEAKAAVEKLDQRLEKEKVNPQRTFYLGPTLATLKLQIDPTGAIKKLSGDTDMEELQKTLQELAKKAGKTAPLQDSDPLEAQDLSIPLDLPDEPVAPEASNEAPSEQAPAAPEQAPAQEQPPSEPEAPSNEAP